MTSFGLDNLRLCEVPTPTPKENEVLIKVAAVSLNFRDKAIVDGIYELEVIPKPLISVSDAVRVVVAVGAGVTHLKEGDRVNSHLYSNWVDGTAKPNEPDFCYGAPLPDGLAEYMVLHAASAVKVPEAMTDEEASTLPIAALTAFDDGLRPALAGSGCIGCTWKRASWCDARSASVWCAIERSSLG